MIRMKKWMKLLSRAMVMNMVWLAWAVTSAEAHPVQKVSLVDPDGFSKMDQFQETLDDAVPVDLQSNLVMGGDVHWAVLQATHYYSQGENQKFPEKNTVFANVGNYGGFIITYSAVLAGYLVLYVPLGSYGGVKCIFDKEGWNDCWNGYMNRIFH